MLKLLGAILIVFAGLMLGRLQARKLSDRPGQIRRFVRLLGQLETEISYGFTPLPDALHKLGEQSVEPFGRLLSEIADCLNKEDRPVLEVWKQTVEQHWHRMAMRAGEKEVIVGLGSTLGTTDREDQIKHLRLAAKQLESMEADAAEERRKYEKMWRSLGLLGGALIAVIMY